MRAFDQFSYDVVHNEGVAIKGNLFEQYFSAVLFIILDTVISLLTM